MLSKNKPFIITIIAAGVLALLVAMTSASAPPAAARAATAVGGIFVPLEEFFYGLSDSIRQSMAAADEPAPVDNSAEYAVMMIDYNELKAENERLKAMLAYKNAQPEKDLVPARITGKEPGNWFEVFTISAGSNDGIKEDMAVVTPDGLVGRIEEVGLNWSKVMSVIDSRSRVPVIVERTRDVGVAGGPLSGDNVKNLSMNYLPLDSDISAGDIVVTSGLGDLFPRGIPVGQVAAKTDPKDTEISITPLVDFTSLYDVFVVTDARETTSVANDDITDHNAVLQAPQSTPSASPSMTPEAGTTTGDGTQPQATPVPAEDAAAQPTQSQNNTTTEIITPSTVPQPTPYAGIPDPIAPSNEPPQVIPPGSTDTEIITPGGGAQ